MPKKIDPAVKARAVRLVREHRSEYPSLTAAVQAEVDVGERPGTSSKESAEVKALKAKVRRLEEDNAMTTLTISYPLCHTDARAADEIGAGLFSAGCGPSWTTCGFGGRPVSLRRIGLSAYFARYSGTSLTRIRL